MADRLELGVLSLSYFVMTQERSEKFSHSGQNMRSMPEDSMNQKNAKPQFEQVLVAPCRYNYGPMQIQYEQTQVRGYLSGESLSDIKSRKSDGAVPSVVASEPYEIVLKVANISPMPDKQQENKPETLFGYLENGHNENVDQVNAKKSIDFLDNEDEIDLSNAPIFQILCETQRK